MSLDKTSLNERAISQLDSLIKDFHDKYGDRKEVSDSNRYEYWYNLSEQEASAIIARFTAAINRLSPPSSPYRQSAATATKYADHMPSLPSIVGLLLGILEALRDDLKAGYVDTLSELIHAELFADFIGMAKHLMEEGYKDPAAVIAGSVLEEHLRKLCVKNGLPIEHVTPNGNVPLKAAQLNNDLKAAEVYNKAEQSSVLSWLQIRNSAAHGNYDDYDNQQANFMVQSVEAFLLRYPA